MYELQKPPKQCKLLDHLSKSSSRDYLQNNVLKRLIKAITKSKSMLLDENTLKNLCKLLTHLDDLIAFDPKILLLSMKMINRIAEQTKVRKLIMSSGLL